MKKIIVANWKMNPTSFKGAKLLFEGVKKGVRRLKLKNVEVVICPPFVYLSNIKFQMPNIKLGAQDCFWEEKGAFTGEISPLMLKDLKVDYVILGHSERRKYFFESNEMINKKIKACLAQNLKPILCIGETEKEKKLGKTKEVLNQQLCQGLKEIKNYQLKIKNLVLAYEPVWAIGTGNACLPEEAKKVLLFLRKKIKNIPILYGGSVNSQNAKSYIEIGFNGLLVGGASLASEEFVNILRNIH